MADIARRREAALTSGVVPWNRLPASFKRIHSAKRSSSEESEPQCATAPRHPAPKIQLQPENGVRGRVGATRAHPVAAKKSIVVTLPTDSGAVRPKTANFPARNFLAGYRQIPSRGSVRHDPGDGESDRLSRSSSILMLSPSVGNGPGARQDLDQMDDAELNQIFEELVAVDDEVESKPTEKLKVPKGRVGIHPEATEMKDDGLEIPTAASFPQHNLETFSTSSDYPADAFGGGRCTPTYYRALSASRQPSGGMLDAGQLVHSHDNLVYVPRPKTRLCRVYVGSTVTRPSSRSRALEFLPVNRQAWLHNRGTVKSRPNSGVSGKPVQYSTNFSCYYGPKTGNSYAFPFTHPGTPEPDCIMCQHYLQR